MQRLTEANLNDALIKEGDAFSKGPISLEFDRLVELYRNNGFLRFGRDDLIGVWDTLDIALLEPSLDPFDQIRILEKTCTKKETSHG